MRGREGDETAPRPEKGLVQGGRDPGTSAHEAGKEPVGRSQNEHSKWCFCSFMFKNGFIELGVALPACNSSSLEAEEGGSQQVLGPQFTKRDPVSKRKFLLGYN